MNGDGYKTRFDEEGRVVWRDIILPIPIDPGEKVDMGRIKCPLMLVVGEDDQNWARVESAKDIAQMMRAAGNEHLLTILQYPDAGHLIELPYTPHFRASNFIVPQTLQKVIMLWKGTQSSTPMLKKTPGKRALAFYGNTCIPAMTLSLRPSCDVTPEKPPGHSMID
uniref:BAAT/Acyl-CoA thioester hydrolase C-terminal domain-containing protein n=2 Tax=Hucho hucho TaxID=62062 RepID=A0A4W5NTV0_9TELE